MVEGEEPTERIEPARKAASRIRSRVPDHEITELRDVDFPMSMRGYDRAAVDAYVSRVNRLLAELQITAAPESAIRHALDQVADETRGILERAHETAEDITARSRSQADDRLQRAESEAEEVRQSADDYAREIRAVAEKQVKALQADRDRVWDERDAVISSLRDLSAQLEQIADAAGERYPAPPELAPTPEPEPEPKPPPPPPPPPPDDEEEERHPALDDF